MANKYYVTFGQDHTHKINGKVFDRDCVCLIEADSYDAGRKKAFELFGRKFGMFYTSMPEMKFFPRGVMQH